MAKKKSRGDNEGSIYKHPNGRWVASISLGYTTVVEDGIAKQKRDRRYDYFGTRREAATWLARQIRDRDLGVMVADERQTLGQFLDRWLEDTVKPTVRPRTYDSYEAHVRLHIEPALGSVPLAKLSPQQVQRFLNDKLSDGLSPSTVQRIRATLRNALGTAYKWNLVARNAAALVDPPRAPKPEHLPFTADEARTFIEAVRGDRLEALYVLALSRGLRQGELLGLRWQDIELGAGTLRVRQSLQPIDGRRQLVEPKTETSRRTLTLPDSVADLLRRHRRRQMSDRLAAGDAWHEPIPGLVFETATGSPLIGSNVTRGFQRLLKRNGLSKRPFKELRHTTATFMLSQGEDLEVIRDTLGHSSITLTADTYAHVQRDLKRKSADRMGEFLEDIGFGVVA